MWKSLFKSAALAAAVMVSFSMASSETQAQCVRGGGFGGVGFGGTGFSISVGNGFNNFGGFYGGFNRGIPFNTFGPSIYRSPVPIYRSYSRYGGYPGRSLPYYRYVPGGGPRGHIRF
ncbi:MAG: hypothetical protein AAF939_20950 [Planctomycetota bacterium]